MPVVKAPLHTAMPPIVHVLKPHKSSVLLPADWALDGKFGHMAFETGDAGRLVRLAEVLRWLQSSRGLPRTDALKLLCDGLNAEVMGWLYWLQPTTWAVPVSPAHTFGYATAEQIAVRKEKDGQQQRQAWLERERQNNRFGTSMTAINGRISTSYPEPTEPGLPALLKYLQGWWTLSTRRGATCDVLDDLKIRHATTLAIRLDKAHALWDYGRIERNEKVINMPAIKPPTGWKLHDSRGHMAFDETHASRLVSLSELVNWMMEEKQLPCGEVVSRLCKEIEAGSGGAQWLYVLQKGGFAKPLTNDYSFAWEPIVSFWDVAQPVDAANLGAAGLAKHLRSYWSDAIAPGGGNYMGQEVLDPIAMPIIKAHQLFDYGNEAATPLPAQTLPTAKEWTGAVLAAQLSLFKADGKAAPMQRLATLTGLNDRKIRHLIAGAGAPQTSVTLARVWLGRVVKKR